MLYAQLVDANGDAADICFLIAAVLAAVSVVPTVRAYTVGLIALAVTAIAIGLLFLT